MRTRAATQLLRRIHDGDSSAADDLLPLVYEQLRRLAQRFIRNERDRHTLQPTALVHEAYLKLVHGGGDWADREHFCAVAATAMRQILSNHARGKRAAKRDGVRADVSIDQLATPSGDHSIDLIALDEALTKLSELDERLARIVELRFFSGLTMDEIADHLKMSRRTAQRDWRWVRAWLSNELSEELES
ncbi:MAG TPA: ECF-type sigma factor [Phycisphaerae bacterium]|nr:ECF-type sigma factor [Phycisphaerae bacterium]HRW52968.1 ECF-type sigma factor [Phycisphaerae bacterium]